MTLTSRIVAVTLSVVALGTVTFAAASDPAVSFAARAVNMEEPMGRASGLVQVRVTRWATDAERDDLTNTLLRDGQKGLLAALSKLPRAGLVRTPGTVGYPFKYARRIASADGNDTILVIIDRPIGFTELRQGSQTRDYPFTVLEMQVNDQGEGAGRILAATKISASAVTRDISFEHYNASAMLLQNVRRE